MSTAGLMAWWLQLPVVCLALFCTLVVCTPWAADLATRVMVGYLLLLTAASAASLLPVDFRGALTGGSLVALAAVSFVAAVLVGPKARLRPQLVATDAAVIAMGMVTAGLLALPYVGGSSDDVALDLARGIDTVHHYGMVQSLVGGPGSEIWKLYDSYPIGVHSALAWLMGAWGVQGDSDNVRAFAYATVAMLGVGVMMLGWIAVSVASRAHAHGSARSRGAITVLALGTLLTVGGSLSAPFELGHTPFMVAAIGGAAASWLAFEFGARSRVAGLVVLGAGGLALLGTYQVLVVALIPAGLRVLWPTSRATWLRALAVAVAVPVAFGVALASPLATEMRIRALVPGEYSTPLVVSLLLVGLTGALGLLARRLGARAPMEQALGASFGFLGAALCLALLGSTGGLALSDNYYAAKLGEAAWLVASPVFVALVVWLLAKSLPAAAGRYGTAVVGVSALVLMLPLALLPIGRYPGTLAGLHLLVIRMQEAELARGQVDAITAARLAGPSHGDASLVPEPAGWLQPYAGTDADPQPWIRQPALAALWMSSARRGRSASADALARCQLGGRGGIESIPCVEQWLRADEARTATLAIGAASSQYAWARLARDFPGRVRILVLPPTAKP